MNSQRLRSASETVVLTLGRSPIVGVLGVGLLIGLVVSGQRVLSLPWQDHALELSALAFATLILWQIVHRTATRATAFPVAPFLAVTIATGLMIRLAYVSAIEPEWYSDFERYWRYGLELAKSDGGQITNGYLRRANFITRPLIELFGPRPAVVPYSNVLVLTLIQIIGYDILRRVRSHQAAQGFSLLWLVVPIPLMSAVVPNHDLVGMLLVSAAVWLGLIAQFHDSATTRKSVSVACWIAAGVLVALLEAIRGLGTLYLICLTLITLAALAVALIRGARKIPSSRRRAILSLVGLVLVIASSAATESALRKAGMLTSHETERHARIRYTTPHTTSLSDGTYAFMRAFELAFMTEFREDPEAFASFRRSLALTDFIVEPTDRLQASLKRMQRQYSLGSQLGFYLRGVDAPARRILGAYNIFFAMSFVAMLLLAIIRLAQRRIDVPIVESFLLLLTAAISAAMLLIGENQPRYLSLLWLAGAIAIPSQMAAESLARDRAPGPAWLLATSAGVLVALLAAFWLLATWIFTPARGLILHDWTLSGPGADAGTREFLATLQDRRSTVMKGRDGEPILAKFDELSLKLMLPSPRPQPNGASARTSVCGLNPPVEFEFQYHAPGGTLMRNGELSLELRANENLIWSSPLSDRAHPRRVRTRLPLDDGGCTNLRFDLTIRGEPSRSYRQEDTFVEIFFPRIDTPSTMPEG
ncbi:hypothetical protein H0E84_02900 [Luteimonas sp. SJ-92]|uniref:Glycosyltransferase RgtA/B/C/D-like domain-containing protein n=1 Tax=Luteimonas salinisoli TaxID=2752307 RepID=A0A853J9F4_9GAMM|nr:hypothetical protein [Luteimonas salinisoli]NZA25319.1 hypothetical protein [Luteimonas salinisoli]